MAELDEYFAVAWHLRRWRRLHWEHRLEEEWRANSYKDDCLDVYGKQHAVVPDYGLQRLVARAMGIASDSEIPDAKRQTAS